MGLDGFLSFVKKKYPDVLKTHHISEFSYNNVFMDISSYIYKTICIFGTQNPQWISSMLQIFLTLRGNKVNIIPIFDGKPPDAKKDEIAERKEKRNKIKTKISTIETIIEKLELKEQLDEEEYKFTKDILDNLEEKGSTTQLKRLLTISSSGGNSSTDNRQFTSSNINDLQGYVSNLKRQMFYISEKEIEIVKSMLDILGIKYYTSPEEAEAYCCSMLRKGIGNAVISCDTDCFAHGAKCVITSFDHNTGTINYIYLEDLLNEMELSHAQFVDFAILIGCDYNKKNKLPKVGPVKALQLIQKYGCIEKIEGYDISNVNQVAIRKLFCPDYEEIEEYVETEIDEDALDEFIEEYHLRISKERLKNALKIVKEKPTIVWD